MAEEGAAGLPLRGVEADGGAQASGAFKRSFCFDPDPCSDHSGLQVFHRRVGSKALASFQVQPRDEAETSGAEDRAGTMGRLHPGNPNQYEQIRNNEIIARFFRTLDTLTQHETMES